MTQALPIALPKPALFLVPTAAPVDYPPASQQTGRVPAPRRRPSPQQGIALEILGHAIEYLVDTNFYHQRAENPDVQDALTILKQSSREIFVAAPALLPARTRAAQWLRSRLHTPAVATDPANSAQLYLVKR